ncbi:hypothetical protein NFJ02_24g54430 [Pycnococcus provasolii]
MATPTSVLLPSWRRLTLLCSQRTSQVPFAFAFASPFSSSTSESSPPPSGPTSEKPTVNEEWGLPSTNKQRARRDSERCSKFTRSFASSAASASASAASETAPTMDDINDLFVEARDLLEDARDSMETVYFNEEFHDAKQAVQETLQAWEEHLSSIQDQDKKDALMRSNGMKMEQLRAELATLEDMLLEDDH